MRAHERDSPVRAMPSSPRHRWQRTCMGDWGFSGVQVPTRTTDVATDLWRPNRIDPYMDLLGPFLVPENEPTFHLSSRVHAVFYPRSVRVPYLL